MTNFSINNEMAGGGGLIYLRARTRKLYAPERFLRMGYDPASGRFLTKDTWSGDYNNPITLAKWLYANGNPVMYTDPSGKCYTNKNVFSQGYWERFFEAPFLGPCNSNSGIYTSICNAPTTIPSATITNTPTSLPTSTPTLTPTQTPYCGGSFVACMTLPVENGTIGTRYGHQNTMDDDWDLKIGTNVPTRQLPNGNFWEGGILTKEDYLRLWGIHAGVDIYGSGNPPIFSIYDGKVYATYNASDNGGNKVIIQHLFENAIYYSIYFHLNDISVVNNQKVSKGTKIGTMGSSGATSIHLHFELRTSSGMSNLFSPDWYWANSASELQSNWVDISFRFSGYDPFLPNDWR